MCRQVKKNNVFNHLPPWDGGQIPKVFHQELHEICTSAQKNNVSNLHAMGMWVRGLRPKNIFARNCMKCADLNREIMVLAPTQCGEVKYQNLVGIA